MNEEQIVEDLREVYKRALEVVDAFEEEKPNLASLSILELTAIAFARKTKTYVERISLLTRQNKMLVEAIEKHERNNWKSVDGRREDDHELYSVLDYVLEEKQ